MNPFFQALEKAKIQMKHVRINDGKILSLATAWAKEEFVLPNFRETFIWPTDDDDFVQFLGLTTAVNFCFRYPDCGNLKFQIFWRGETQDGSGAMRACVIRAIERGMPLLDSVFLSDISLEDTRKIFSTDMGPEIPLIEARMKIWREVGKVLLSKYGGHFKNLLEKAGYRCFNKGEGICERLVKDFPVSFKDIRLAAYGEKLLYLPFYKKSLLFPLEYYGRAEDSAVLPKIKDIQKLSPLAGHQLPRALREKGAIEYGAELGHMVDSFKQIPHQTYFEIEIRHATVLVVARLLSEINKIRNQLKKTKINMVHLDFRLWQAGRNSKKPPHITLTTNY